MNTKVTWEEKREAICSFLYRRGWKTSFYTQVKSFQRSHQSFSESTEIKNTCRERRLTGGPPQNTRHTRGSEMTCGGLCAKTGAEIYRSSSEAGQDAVRMASVVGTDSHGWKKRPPCPRLDPEPPSVDVCRPQAAFPHSVCSKHIGYI